MREDILRWLARHEATVRFERREANPGSTTVVIESRRCSATRAVSDSADIPSRLVSLEEGMRLCVRQLDHQIGS